MKAIVQHRYGTADQLAFADVPKPQPGPGEVRVHVHATSLNASDIEMMTGSPAYIRMSGLFRPSRKIPGSDFAGIIETLGEGVTEFAIGDAVYGDVLGQSGGLAEYLCAPVDVLSRKPEHLSFVDAASIPQAGGVARQGLAFGGGLEAGQRVLINGAGGGAGSFAIQFAKMQGLHVTGVDTGEKLEAMLAFGADEVVDFRKDDFTKSGAGYDLILDLVAHRALSDHLSALAPGGRYALVGGAMLRIFGVLLKGYVLGKLTGKHPGMLIHKGSPLDNDCIAGWLGDGSIRTVVDKVFGFDEGIEAMRYQAQGHARGKIVVEMIAD